MWLGDVLIGIKNRVRQSLAKRVGKDLLPVSTFVQVCFSRSEIKPDKQEHMSYVFLALGCPLQ